MTSMTTKTESKLVPSFQKSLGDKAGVKVGDRLVLIDNKPSVKRRGSEEPAFLKPNFTAILLTIQRGQLIQRLRVRLKNLL